jgi:hypothetical protein
VPSRESSSAIASRRLREKKKKKHFENASSSQNCILLLSGPIVSISCRPRIDADFASPSSLSLLCCVSRLSSRLLCGNSSKAVEEPRLSIGLALDRREVQMFPAQCTCCSSTEENQAVLFLKALRCTTETAAVPALQKSFASCLSHIDLRSSREICTPIW